MNTEIIGKVSGVIVLVSALAYMIRVWQKKIVPNPITWFIWSVEGVALLANYKSLGAVDNVWPAVFGAFNPVIILLIALFHGKISRVDWFDYACLFLGIASLSIWGYDVFTGKDPSGFALYMGILGDAFAAVPTFFFLLRNPKDDRPFMWVAYGIGYGLALLAVPKHSIANDLLPVYMCIMALVVAFPLVRYRLAQGIPLKEWI